MTEHSKSPWTYYHEKTGDCFVIRSDEQGAIAETFTSSDSARSNAILIAESPALLKALDWALKNVRLPTSVDAEEFAGKFNQARETALRARDQV